MNREKYYDKQIAPKLKDVMDICEKNNMSFVAVCEFNPGEYGSSRAVSHDASQAIRMCEMLTRANGNFDSFVIAVMRHANKHGHSSIILKMHVVSGRRKAIPVRC